ncbi:MAG: HAD family hydrolase [Bacillota bacterium]|nr:HAD family hydrolase [Bacillota bacterium]
MLFDFGSTLTVCPAWMDLELDTLVDVVLAGLAGRGWPVPREVDHQRGRRMLRHLREVARTTWMECPARRCVQAILPALGVPVPPGSVLDRVLEDVYGRLLPEVSWVPGSRQLLASLAGEGVALGLVSNAAYAPLIRRVLGEAGVALLFGTVIISAELGWRKPHPAPFLRALGDLGVAPGEACHVGDHFHQDVVGAARAGIRPVWISAAGGDGTGYPPLYDRAAGVPEPSGPATLARLPGGATPVVVPDLRGAAEFVLGAIRENGKEGPRR